MITAGVTRVDITPPVGVWLSGFIHRFTPSESIRDKLYATAVVLEADGRKAAIVGCDLIGVDDTLRNRVGELVEAGNGIDRDHLLLNASHTHAGPNVLRRLRIGAVDEAYLDTLGLKIVTAIRQADDARRPVALSWGTAHASISFNRRRRKSDGLTPLDSGPDGPIDHTVRVLRLDTEDGHPRAILFSYACHPVSFGDLKISSDFAGATSRLIESQVGGQAMSLFLQGCAGNINPLVDQTDPERRVQQHGQTLCTAVMEAMATARPVKAAPIAGQAREIPLPLQDPPLLEEAASALSHWQDEADQARARDDPSREVLAKAMVDWSKELVAVAKAGARPRTKTLAVNVLRLGDLAIAAGGAEPHIESALGIAARSPFEQTMVLGYTNGLIGYLPPAEAFLEGGYEVQEAFKYFGALMLRPECESLFTDTVINLMGKLM